MMRLLRVELTRLRWRRAVLLLLCAAFLIPGLLFAATVWESRPSSAEDIAWAEREAEGEAEQPWVQEELAACLETPENYDAAGDPERLCPDRVLPQADWFLYRPQLDLGEQLTASGPGVVVVVVLLLTLVGATFVGADWSSGSMSNQLLFEARRGRIWLAKAIAVLLTGLVVSALVWAAYWAGLWGVAESRDLTTSAATLREVTLAGARFSALAGAAAVGGYALTMLFRSTVGTLGVVLTAATAGYVLVLSLPGTGTHRWMLHHNVFGLVHDGWQYYDPTLCRGAVDCDGMTSLSAGPATTYLGALLVLALVPSALSFLRRDVP